MLVPLTTALHGSKEVRAGASNDKLFVRVPTMADAVRYTNLETPARLTGVKHVTELEVVHDVDAQTCDETATVAVIFEAPIFIPCSVNATPDCLPK
jgi:hypothetical protein